MKLIINYALYVFTVTFLFYLVTTMNSSFMLISLEPSYSTTFSPSGKFKPGSGESQTNIPAATSNDPVGPFTPGGGNAERNGSSVIPDNTTDPRTPVEPGNIPTHIGDRWAHLTVHFTTDNNYPMIYCIATAGPTYIQYKANPYCVQTNENTSTFHLLQAPGYLNVSIGNFVDNLGGSSTCFGDVRLYEIKSCAINIIDYGKQ
jgi:hypothetical protein